jgi:hypothetical protein
MVKVSSKNSLYKRVLNFLGLDDIDVPEKTLGLYDRLVSYIKEEPLDGI